MSNTCRHTAKRRPLVGVAGATIVASALMASFGGGAQAAAGGKPYGGFSTAATGMALQVGLFSPAIPIPVDPGMPQAELDLSYSTVTGSSGPTATSMASSAWPGNAVGNGLPVILSSFGAPAALANNNYPVHVNAQYPGTPRSGSQSPIPGSISTVSSSAKKSEARAGFSTSGQTAGDQGTGPDLLSAIKSGNLSALGNAIAPTTSGQASNPLGALSAVISVGGMSSTSVTDYSDPTIVTATTTTEVGNVSLLGGAVKLSGIKVQSATSSSLDGGGKAVQTVDYGTLTLAGQTFKLTDKGVVAAGKTSAVPIPSLTQLAKLGISIDLPKPTKKAEGGSVVAHASGPVITIDTAPILTMLQLGKLPLGDVIGKLPSSADQVKSTLLGVLEANPKIVVTLGTATSSADTITAIQFPTGGGTTPTPPPSPTPPGAPTGAGGGTGTMGGTGVTNPPATNSPGAVSNTQIQQVSDIPGLPPLGSIPGMLTFLGLILAAALAWFFRGAAFAALGAGSTCPHGLAKGLPDLRKA